MEELVLRSTPDPSYEARCRDYFASSGFASHPVDLRSPLIATSLEATYRSSTDIAAGTIRVSMRTEAGVVRYPVGDFSALRIFGEGGRPDRWDVQCFVYGPAYQEGLAPDAEPVGRMLADQLEANGICSRPIWVGWHGAVRIGGEIRDA